MFNKEYTHNIKFTDFGDYCLTGHGDDVEEGSIVLQPCDEIAFLPGPEAVSYTHLTLPTKA